MRCSGAHVQELVDRILESHEVAALEPLLEGATVETLIFLRIEPRVLRLRRGVSDLPHQRLEPEDELAPMLQVGTFPELGELALKVRGVLAGIVVVAEQFRPVGQ